MSVKKTLLLKNMNKLVGNAFQETIQKAKTEPEKLSPSGRKIHPPWTDLISFEQLYGVPDSDFIDKKAGLASDEELDAVRRLRELYYRQFEFSKRQGP